MRVGLCSVMVDSRELTERVVETCRCDVDRHQVRPIVEQADEEQFCDRSVFVERLAFAIDVEMGAAQSDFEEHVINEGGFVVEEDGVVYGFDESGAEI